MSLIAPALSAKTPLASLDGYDLLLQCPKCGVRIKPVSKLYAVVDRYSEIGSIIPRLACDGRKSKPVALRAVNSWVVKIRPRDGYRGSVIPSAMADVTSRMSRLVNR
jgi:hypothetical protein